MFKKLASIALAAMMISSTAVIANAAETEEAVAAAEDSSAVAAADESAVGADADSATGADTNIYFEAPSFWGNYKDIRLYLYEYGGEGTVFINWNSKSGRMTDMGDGKWSFDMSKYPMDDSKNYGAIFLTNTETQTCDILIGNPCLGDTAYCTGENDKVENAVDSNKSSYNVRWRNADPSRFAPPLLITSVGNVVGEAVVPGDSKQAILERFLKSTGKDGLQNAKKYKPDQTEQQIIDGVASSLGLSNSDVQAAVDSAKAAGVSIEWTNPDGGSSSSSNNSSSSSNNSSSSNSSSSNSSSSNSSSTNKSTASNSSSSSSSSSSTGTTGSTSSVTSGQETTIFFVFGGVMLAAAGIIFLARKRREF